MKTFQRLGGGLCFKHNSGKLTLLKGIGERAKRERHYIQHVCRFCPLTCSDFFFLIVTRTLCLHVSSDLFKRRRGNDITLFVIYSVVQASR